MLFLGFAKTGYGNVVYEYITQKYRLNIPQATSINDSQWNDHHSPWRNA